MAFANIKYWLVLKDDAKRTFEVCGQSASDNAFYNRTHGMQKAGMNVSCMTPPVTGQTPNKASIKIVGYTPEPGLEERLMNQYRGLTMDYFDED